MRRPLLAVAALLLAAPLTPPAAAADYTVESYCRFVLKSVPTREPEVYVAIVAEAHALGPVPATTTTVTCTATNYRGEVLTATLPMAGPEAYVAAFRVMHWSGVTVCSESEATWTTPELSTVHVVEDKDCRPGDS